SLFSIYLPCGEEKDLVLGELSSEVKGSGKTEKPGKAFREAPVSGEQQKYATVLFAEDDEVVREFSREMLLSLGYRVIVAKNGREAVNLFSLLRDRIDALVFDVMMPEMNGLDAYRAIAAMGSPPPVLFCTAFMDTGLPEDFKGREDVWILKKPFGVEDFREKMEELFPESGQQGDMG
ncbi:MAG TPA: response regulator, partial [Synergistaceae bacterium]|nr:response regulator [Synergistaceae bacterium]